MWRSSFWRSAMPASLAALSSCRVLLLLDSKCCILAQPGAAPVIVPTYKVDVKHV